MKREKAITLISLVITIVVLIILAAVAINLSLGNNGIFKRASEAKEATNKQTATEKINLKITTAQMNSYAEKQEMPTLKELSLVLKEDNEIEYVIEKGQKSASARYDVPSENPESIYTRLKEYPTYEFEINGQLQLASINGVPVAGLGDNNNPNAYSLEETKTNETWMGKPIYRKVIYIEKLPNATSKEYSHGIENIETIWINTTKSFFYSGNDGIYTPLPSVSSSDVTIQVKIDARKSTVKINTGSVDRRDCTAYVTLEYTKTTDNPS